jgi:amino acid adenylation domain-containing protein
MINEFAGMNNFTNSIKDATTKSSSVTSLQPGADTEDESLHSLEVGFLHSAELFPDRPALELGGNTYTYYELLDRAASWAATLQQHSPSEPRFTAVYASRSAVAYTGILAALLRGHAYVPLHPRFPAARTKSFLQRSGCRTLIVDEEGEKSLGEVLDGIELETVILMPSKSSVKALASQWPRHIFLGADAVVRASGSRRLVKLDDLAYLLFTSGSTGEPKGVTISHRNVAHLVRTMVQRYDIDKEDRVSQFADLNFDASVFNVFATWERGACAVCPDAKTLLNPVAFLASTRISIFQSVPSSGLLMMRLGGLKPNRFPQMRVSLFGGEALPADLARVWQNAAPNSVVENLYGPTELTVNSTAYRWHPDSSPGESADGIVPIGDLLPGVKGLVVDEELREVSPGEKGELLLAGPQRTPGYINDPDGSSRMLVVPPGRHELYYRTGDIVRQAPGKTFYLFLGRRDQQVKIFGMRIELGEIEAALREEAGVIEVAAVAWPISQGSARGIVAFVGNREVDVRRVRDGLKRRLPQQMVPREIRLMERLPLNSNGKVDRLALRSILETSS